MLKTEEWQEFLLSLFGGNLWRSGAKKRQLREMTITGDQNCYSLDPADTWYTFHFLYTV